MIASWEAPTRQLMNRLVDGFVEQGACDVMADLAGPFPGLAFFDLTLHAPADDLERVNHYATMASLPHVPSRGVPAEAGRMDRRARRAAPRRGAPGRATMLRFCEQAEIPTALRARPELIRAAVRCNNR